MASKRHIDRTAIETWIEGYLKVITSKARLREERKFLQKAIALINIILTGGPCCTGDSVSLITPYDNQLTHTILQILQKDNIVRRTYRKSLIRIVNLITKLLYGCCCTNVTFTFVLGSGITTSDTQAQFFDSVTNELIGQTSLDGDTVQTLCIPVKYFNSSQVNICLNSPVSPSPNEYQLRDQDGNVIVHSTVSGQFCIDPSTIATGTNYNIVLFVSPG